MYHIYSSEWHGVFLPQVLAHIKALGGNPLLERLVEEITKVCFLP